MGKLKALHNRTGYLPGAPHAMSRQRGKGAFDCIGCTGFRDVCLLGLATLILNFRLTHTRSAPLSRILRLLSTRLRLEPHQRFQPLNSPEPKYR